MLVNNGYFVEHAGKECVDSASCSPTTFVPDHLSEARIPWKVDVSLQCVGGFQSDLPKFATYACRFENSTSDKLALWRSDPGANQATEFDPSRACHEDNNNLGDTWVVRGGAFLSLVAGGMLVKLFALQPEVRRSAVDLDHVLLLSLALCAVALCSFWGSLSKVDCKRQGPATLAATLSTLVLALHLNVSVFRNLRIRADGTRRPPHRLLVKLALVIFGWIVPIAVGVIVALTSLDNSFTLEHENSDEPFLCTWGRDRPDTKIRRWLCSDGPAVSVYTISALLASRMLFSWCGCAQGVGNPRAVAASRGGLEVSLLESEARGGTGLERQGALAELDEGARRVADLAGRQLWMLLSFLLCWTPRMFLTLLDVFEVSLDHDKSTPIAVVVARHLHALLWPLQGFFLALAFKNVQNGGVLQEKGSYEELMARIGYARQEALSSTVSHRLSLDSPGLSQGNSIRAADVAAIRSGVSAGV